MATTKKKAKKKVGPHKKAVGLFLNEEEDFAGIDELIEEVKAKTSWKKFARSPVVRALLKICTASLRKGEIKPEEIQDDTTLQIVLLALIKDLTIEDLIKLR